MFEITEFTEARLAVKPKRKRRPLLVTHRGERVPPYFPVAERAFGGPLPKGAEVHHIDENPFNNEPSNLVICPDAAYHKLLHQRQRAFAACGHYDWRKCHICKQYDAPQNLWTSRKKAHHRECDAARARAYAQSKAQKEAN